MTLHARLFGHVPEGLTEHNVRIEGGERIRGIGVLSATFVADEDGDMCLHVVVDRRGDFSTYCLCLVEHAEDIITLCGHDPLPPEPLARRAPPGVDPRYACVEFSFRIDCPSQLDCRPQPCPSDPQPAPPVIDYLARDFPSFRALLLDRLATTMPQWRERHVPDLGLTLVELLAYKADQLSYQLDAVATEAYLATARRRISVRRHARLVDYRLHEGCNARAWITLDSDRDVPLDLADLVFACPPADTAIAAGGVMDWPAMQETAGATLYEPMALAGTFVDVPDVGAPDGALRSTKPVIQVRAAHSTIHFYTWRFESCCLPQGSTRATLLDQLDAGTADGKRVLQLAEGNYLILEETCGAATGSRADADRSKRHVVKLVRVEPTTDPLDGTLLLEVEWDRRDALPFALCLSARTAPPSCKTIEVAVARGNVLLVDHGAHPDKDEDGWVVQVERETGCCECDGMVADTVSVAAALRFTLGRSQVTHAALPPPRGAPASQLCVQHPRQALPQIHLDLGTPDLRDSQKAHWRGSYAWRPVLDLLSSNGNDPVFVAEIDDDGIANIRFGDGIGGMQPQAGWRFRARYRVGNGQRGNVGADSIVWVARRSGPITGVSLSPRNPLAACGGIDPEPVADAKLFAPHAYARLLERAVRAEDYAQIAMADPRMAGANAELAWTGAWYEATVALDAYAAAENDTELADTTLERLLGVRRIGHDVRIVPARRVPLRVELDLCVAPGHARADVVRAALDVLSNRSLPNGDLGLFHADRIVFGEDMAGSRVVAAVQRVTGVAHVELRAFARADADGDLARKSLADGLVAIAADEIAQLDNDPDFPERGVLKLTTRGGR
ncbi:hypothetical protein ASC87_14055 [Rhizobacter sp. Root1221]|nr:hypothetical protein ASC87_14055 [Rhizobacter sp. Root1221]